jgi:hypothetical protein
MLPPAFFGDHPRTVLPRRLMPHVLRVAAGEVGNPMRCIIFVESDNGLLHVSDVAMIRS